MGFLQCGVGSECSQVWFGGGAAVAVGCVWSGEVASRVWVHCR